MLVLMESFSAIHTYLNTRTLQVKVMAFIFHCATGDRKYLHCLAEAVPGDFGLGEERAPITQRQGSNCSCEYVICLHCVPAE